ncbi:hypothetical protein LTR48_004005 [Friedmanniomyces endolithicus]|uniref:Non-hemolytic phospholipase C n=1 Tax=Rachicladosporium monterosium TaxID=1507873 RepID=A0ABR0LFD7_9PEZI|nr:hypothetical protein LTR48_004005 [Friedmanniomyces endolithicus]KAK5147946.1 hypothetical protein LTR32_000696 [Rachicladosporium monterosium]
MAQTLLATLAAASTAYAGSIADIEHVVLFMQENRAFDHYFGTMAGIRGFKDPKVDNGKPVWYQMVNGTLSNATDYLMPWALNYKGGSWNEATQCMEAGDNGWASNHDALNGGLNNNWPLGNTPWYAYRSIGYFTRKDWPNHFAIAEAFTVGDMYQESVIASTNPNRVTWRSGSINAPGSPQAANEGGMTIDNNETPGCEGPNLNCYPLKWTTIPELYEAAGVSWQLYQDTDNFDDNPLAWFQQYQTAANGSELQKKGMSYIGLEKFYEDAASGNLPQVSIIVGPAELSEHPPYTPRDGAWLQQRIVDTVTKSPQYNSTALIISYDETGGWGDHVVPYHSPQGTTGEWVEDPYGEYGYVYTGPGFRLPFYIVSPWTRGGNVYVENVDHISQIKFVEQWLEAKGYNAFDFDHPDLSVPSFPNASYPSTDDKGQWNGYAVCEATYNVTRPPVPYGQQTEATSLVAEEGFKAVRGQLTEGRYLTFEMNGFALTTANGKLTATKATANHDSKTQRFVIHQNGSKYAITSALDSTSVLGPGPMRPGGYNAAAATFAITDLGNGNGYSLKASNGQYLTVGAHGQVSYGHDQCGFSVYSVTYDN